MRLQQPSLLYGGLTSLFAAIVLALDPVRAGLEQGFSLHATYQVCNKYGNCRQESIYWALLIAFIFLGIAVTAILVSIRVPAKAIEQKRSCS